jgi:DNA-binding transcriptional LysR family regulator
MKGGMVLELLQLKYFLVAAEYEHMTKAADALHIAQPALSQSIKHLEEELGVALFDRKNRGIRLNEAGRLLRQELQPLMDTLDALPGRLKEAKHTSARTIQLNLLAASLFITQSIISFKKLYPEVNFRLLQNSEDQEYDLCITCTSAERIPKNSQLLLEEHILLAVPTDSSYALGEEIELKQIEKEGFISFSEAKPFRNICDEYCRKAGFVPKIIFESDNQESVRNLIESNLGVAFWPEFSWGKLMGEHSKLLTIKEPECVRRIYAIQKSHGDNGEYVEAFLEHLMKNVREARDMNGDH